MSDQNPMNREYTKAEWAAAKRTGLYGIVEPKGSGPLVYATGPYYPDHARKQAAKARKLAADWDLLGDAMDREWKKPIPTPEDPGA